MPMTKTSNVPSDVAKLIVMYGFLKLPIHTKTLSVIFSKIGGDFWYIYWDQDVH
jgi:hypothetical protein